MSVTVNIRYYGKNGSAKAFAQEMMQSGTVEAIRKKLGNLTYQYYISWDNPEMILLIAQWINQEALDRHHKSSIMQTIITLRDKYDLHMEVERFISDEAIPNQDQKYIRP